MAICRGIIYHKVFDDFLNIFRSIYINLKDEKKLQNLKMILKSLIKVNFV